MRPLGLAVAFGLACVVAGRADDIVIFKDGYKLQGRRFKEQQVLSDPANGVVVQIPAARGFDIMDDGPRWVIFTSNRQQVGAEITNPEQAGSGRELDRIEPLKPAIIKTVQDLPRLAKYPPLPEFDKDWRRKFKVETGNGNFQIIEQAILKMNPRRLLIASTTHKWQIAYGTRELPVEQVRAILANHPSMSEDPKKPDAGKRLNLVAFFRDAGLLDKAKDELDAAKVAVPGEWDKDLTERYEQLRADIARLRNTAVVDELETALASGRYAAAAGLIVRFDDKVATATDTKRFSGLKATVENVTPRFERTKRMLRDALDDLTDAGRQVPFAAAGGGGIIPFVPRNQTDPRFLELLAAGEQVYAELHPDTAGRVELFFNQGVQAEQQRKAGKGTAIPPSQLVALAVTGWLLGKNGADPSTDAAIRVWTYRKMLLEYQNAATQNERKTAVRKYATNEKPPPDLLAQVISLLPPSAPALPTDGTPIPPSPTAVAGLVRKKTPPLKEAAAGVEYVLRLPPEYHHGRAYPVLLAFTHPGMPAETMVSLLAPDADRNGYIVAAPVWANPADPPYDYKGDKHYMATATLRSLLREYRVDNDRVFLFGFGDGGNFALDVGLSHPDRFAGLVTMAAAPKYQNCMSHYWRNAQKLPVYTVGGNLNGAAYANLRQLYEQWMPKGYPALWSLYRGRSLEWYGVDVPAVFDWMGRKKRVTGTASLRLNTFGVEPWQIMREGDDRFYWVGTSSVRRTNTLADNENRSFVCAEIFADVRQGNQIDIRSRGLLNVVVWLDRDMIDWSKPVSVRLNGGPPKGYKPKVIEPDVEVMLEELYTHGDRTMLFLNKLEFEAIP